jgi:Fe-S-cluster containining protein
MGSSETHAVTARVRLFQDAERWFDRGRAALLSEIPCRRGCSRCCIGPFAITVVDAAGLREGTAHLDTATRQDIEECARRQVASIESEFPRLARSPFVDDWPDMEMDRLVNRFAELRCPALGADGSCRVYEYRPMTCRTMGLPVEPDGLSEGACDVQTAVPIVRLSRALREEEARLVAQEAVAIASHCSGQKTAEELLLPYGFLTDRP